MPRAMESPEGGGGLWPPEPKERGICCKQMPLSLVRVAGVEPARLSAQEPKSCASANSAIPAWLLHALYPMAGGFVNGQF